ncbi:unnamed protein product [Camellia sinensis]
MFISFDHFRTIVNTQSQPVHRLIHSPLTAGNITITIMVMDSFSSTRITTPRFRCFDPATSTSSSSPSNSNSVVRRALWELQPLISVRLSPETMVTFSKMFLTCPTTSPTSLYGIDRIRSGKERGSRANPTYGKLSGMYLWPKSPICQAGVKVQYFVNEDDTVAQQIIVHKNSPGGTHFRRVGPCQKVYFESDEVHASIVTCGGLCPGINTVIREIVCGLYYMYGVNKVLGIEYYAGSKTNRRSTSGFYTFYGDHLISWKSKKQAVVSRSSAEAEYPAMAHGTCEILWIHFILAELGFEETVPSSLFCDNKSTIMLSSNSVLHERTKHIEIDIYFIRERFGPGGYRGFYSRNTIPLTPKVVNDIHKRGGTILGTSRGGHETSKIVDSIQDRGITQEIKRRGLKVAVAGIPKTIDNDIPVIDKSFGFDAGVEETQRAINAAHVEAESFENGVGVVKLMGRYSESPFYLEGPGGLFEFMEKRLKENGHMVIVIAEGAGQELLSESMHTMNQQDASENKLLEDVGLWISQKIKSEEDPTYMIRAIPSIASDNVNCTLLAQSAIHGAMAGYTGFTVGPRVTERQNKVVITDRMWARLLSSTNQPSFLNPKDIIEAKKEEQPKTQLLDGDSVSDEPTSKDNGKSGQAE